MPSRALRPVPEDQRQVGGPERTRCPVFVGSQVGDAKARPTGVHSPVDGRGRRANVVVARDGAHKPGITPVVGGAIDTAGLSCGFLRPLYWQADQSTSPTASPTCGAGLPGIDRTQSARSAATRRSPLCRSPGASIARNRSLVVQPWIASPRGPSLEFSGKAGQALRSQGPDRAGYLRRECWGVALGLLTRSQIVV
jgi:hypothetical protein